MVVVKILNILIMFICELPLTYPLYVAWTEISRPFSVNIFFPNENTVVPKHCPKASPKGGKLSVITVVWIQNMRASVIKDSQRARHLLSIPLKGTCVPTVITTQLSSTKQTTRGSDRGDQLTHTPGCRSAMRWK